MLSFTEDTFEQAVIELFENMGYTHIYAPDMNRTDYSRPLLDDVLRDCLVRLNRSLPAMAIDEAILKLNDFDAGSLLQKNIIFMDYLQNGITVKYAVKGEERSSVVKLIDYADADKNDFYVVNQYTFVENGNNRRPDIILFKQNNIWAAVVSVFHKGILVYHIEIIFVCICIINQLYYRRPFFTLNCVFDRDTVLQIVHKNNILLQ